MKYVVLKVIPGRLGVWPIGKIVSAAILQRDGYDADGLVKKGFIEPRSDSPVSAAHGKADTTMAEK